MSAAGVSIEGVKQAGENLDRVTPSAQTALRTSVSRQTINLQGGVKASIASIFDSTGPLYQSVNSEIEEAPGSVTGTVYTKDIVYAAAQEYGGTWEIPEIFPVNAQALAFGAPAKLGFSSGGMTSGTIFAKHTKAHPVTLPARSYARSTLFRMRGDIMADVQASTAETI